MNDLRRIIEKVVISICLLVATYFTIMCQCDNMLLSCRKYIFYTLVGVPLIYVFSINTF